jgi:predicted Na+-dependent transporter
LLSQVYEVFEDIVIPWQRELKEKRDLLREDPFVGFIVTAIVGAVFYFFTRESPSWIGFLLHYLGIAMFL